MASAARSLGRLGPRNGGAGPSLVSASGFSSFIFWGGVSFAFRGDQAWRPPHHALGHPTSFPSPSPRANFEGRAFQVGEGGSQKGSWRSSERRVRAGVTALGPGRRGLPFLVLPEAPGAKLWRKHHPEGDVQRKSCALDGLCLLTVVFLSPSPCSSLLPPPLFFQIVVCLRLLG